MHSSPTLINRSEALSSLLLDTINESAFYRSFYEDSGLTLGAGLLDHLEERFDDLPILETRHLLELADGFPISFSECFRVTCTGGGLGQPKILYRTAKDWARSGENMSEVFRTAGMERGDVLLVAQPFGLWGIGYLAVEGCRNLKCLAIPFGNQNDWEGLVYLLRRFNVSTAFASPSLWKDFTVWMEERGIDCPLRVLLAGEKISNADRDYLSGYWRMGVYDLYGSEETDALAAECFEHDGMHILEHSYIYQLLKNNRYVPQHLPGEYEGELVITSLYHRGTPIIKYRLGDIVRIERPDRLCKCGNPNPRLRFIAKANQCLMLYDATKLYLSQLDQAIKSALNKSVEYQVIIEDLASAPAKERLTLIILDEQLMESDLQRVINALSHSSPDLADSLRRGQLELRVVPGGAFAERTAKGKRRQIVDRRKDPRS